MTKFRVVTVAREYGSGGGPVAHKLAAALGWELLDRALISRIAKYANVDPKLCRQCDEVVDSWTHRLAKTFTRGAFERTASPGLFDGEAMVRFSRQVIEEAARLGNCVIVGRGGQCILQGREDVFHLFVYAPLEERIRRVKEKFGPEFADPARIRASDRERAAYVKHHYQCEWSNPHLYDAMLTSMLGEDNIVHAILAAMEAGPLKVPEDDAAKQHQPSS